MSVPPDAIPADQWEWRKNFRVWQANRKVFLYPESYLDPDLLDIKTPLFEELEDDLLQQKVTMDSASDAYLRYLTQFAELAHLRIAGSCLPRRDRATYYFFGCTHQDPPVYYWRSWDGTTWSPWRKIDLAIDARTVSAEFHRGRLYLFWVDTKSKDKTVDQRWELTTRVLRGDDLAAVLGSPAQRQVAASPEAGLAAAIADSERRLEQPAPPAVQPDRARDRDTELPRRTWHRATT